MMINQFLDYLRYERNTSPLTVQTYEESLRDFESYVTFRDKELSISSVDTDLIRDWMESLMDKGNSASTINKKLSAVLDDATDKWGVKVNRVELQDITPPDSVLTAMEKQMQAERNKRAQILTSEGQKAAEILASEGEKTAIVNKAEAAKQQAILEAEGEAQARIRKAEAEAKAIELISEAVGKSTNPANYLLAQKYIQMMQELAEGDKTKTVYLPYEATNLLGSIGGIKDLFKSE